MRILLAASVAAGLAASVVAVAGPASAAPAVVRTDAGPVRGIAGPDYRVFDGIPYATPPVGNLRWRPPQPVRPWSGPRDATKAPPECAQPEGFPAEAGSTAEDCLYLNVATPTRSNFRKLPVMVWIHGGGFYSGSGAEYDARRLAVQGKVVVVTLNYRLGALGFLAHPALGDTGDLGLQDQQAALRWVRRNIAAFGGNPHRVTLFGESAGGVSVCSHLSAPGSTGLFQHAIVQSGPCQLNWPYSPSWSPISRQKAESYGLTIAKELGCGDETTAAACLRAVPAKKIADLYNHGAAFSPVYGTDVLPRDPAKAVAGGHIAHVPVMAGSTRDEFRMFEAAIEEFTGPLSGADYSKQLNSSFGAKKAARILARYPISKYGSASVAYSAVMTDWGLACPTLKLDRSLSRHVPTYGYEFADETAPWFSRVPEPGFATGAYHSSELQYLFDWNATTAKLSVNQQRLSDYMIHTWSHFAYTGNPGWPQFRDNRVQSLAPGRHGIHPVDLGAEHQCGFWRNI